MAIMALSMAFLLCSCRTAETAEPQYDVDYSLSTLLIMVQDKTDTDAIDAMFAKYRLTVIYDYENFMMYAVGLDHTYTPDELDDLISDLEQEELVLAVNKDYIYSIDHVSTL